MKCTKCGGDITKPNAKFCPHCGEKINTDSNDSQPTTTNNDTGKSKNGMIIAITAIIIVIIVGITAAYYYDLLGPSSDQVYNSNDNNGSASEVKQSSYDEKAQEVASSGSGEKSSSDGSWKSIGSFSGSGSGSKTIEVPAGQIRIDLSAYPIKNYATNHLYVSGSNGKSAGVDWGPKSAVATRSDSLSFTSSSTTTFTINYYETVSWNVQVYKYQ